MVVRDGNARGDEVAVAGLAATKAIPTDRARYCGSAGGYGELASGGRVAMIEADGDPPLGLEDQAARRSP